MTLADQILTIASRHGWHHLKTQEWCINFKKDTADGKAVINVYWNKSMLPLFTVQTAINHPKKGRTQLNRKNITPEQLEKLFINPRQHTGKGYY